MFNRKLKREVANLRDMISQNYNTQREDYWRLFNDHKRLLDTLKLVRVETNTVEYVKKGGSER